MNKVFPPTSDNATTPAQRRSQKILISPRTVTRLMSGYIRPFDHLIAVFFILISILIASISLVEIAARIAFVSDLEREISMINQELANLNVNRSSDTVAAQLEREMGEKREFRSNLIGMRQHMRIIELNGHINRTITREDVQVRFSKLYGQRYVISDYYGSEQKMPDNSATPSLFEKAVQGVANGFMSMGYWIIEKFESLARRGTESLMIVLVLSCGALGALMAGMRSKEPTSLRDVGLGLAAGFVVYLGTKGGKFLFTLQGVDTSISLNPFGIALLALLVGLYLEKAYTFLTRILQRVEEALDDQAVAVVKAKPRKIAGPATAKSSSGGKP